MGERLEIKQISTPERLFGEILKVATGPVSIVFFGADCDLTSRVYARCHELIFGLAEHCGVTKNVAKAPAKMVLHLSKGDNVFVAMTGEDSISAAHRRAVVNAARDAGAKTVVGFYVKETKLVEREADSWTRTEEQLEKLLSCPPMAEEFDYLIEWTDKEE